MLAIFFIQLYLNIKRGLGNPKFDDFSLGATSIDKIGEVRLSDEIGGEGFETLKKPNFIITIRYEIPTFSSVGPFFEEGGEGVYKISARS